MKVLIFQLMINMPIDNPTNAAPTEFTSPRYSGARYKESAPKSFMKFPFTVEKRISQNTKSTWYLRKCRNSNWMGNEKTNPLSQAFIQQWLRAGGWSHHPSLCSNILISVANEKKKGWEKEYLPKEYARAVTRKGIEANTSLIRRKAIAIQRHRWANDVLSIAGTSLFGKSIICIPPIQARRSCDESGSTHP